MKISILMAMARQVEGEYIFINVLKANTDVEVLNKFLRENDLPRTRKVDQIDCVVEYGVIQDIELEGLNLTALSNLP